jgi:hypothetical protein
MLIHSLEQTQSDVRLMLHLKEATLLASESEHILHREITPLVYVTAGIDLENQQCAMEFFLRSIKINLPPQASLRQRLGAD